MLPWQQDKETGRQVPLYELPALFLDTLIMPKKHGQERGNTLRVYLNAQKAWARERKL
jgi:hypothetical protein